VGVVGALVQIDDAGLAGERLAQAEHQLDSVLPRFQLEGEATVSTRGLAPPFAGVHVDRLDDPSFNRGPAFRCAYGAAE
jgi:hypothetical protein